MVFNTYIMFLDISPIVLFLFKTSSYFCLKHNVSETGFSLRLRVKPIQLGPLSGEIKTG
jgi:hypothetical protein